MPLCFYAFKKFLLKTHKLQSVNLQLFKLEPWARPQLIHLEDHTLWVLEGKSFKKKKNLLTDLK